MIERIQLPKSLSTHIVRAPRALVEGASQDTWKESHLTILILPSDVDPSVTTLHIGSYTFQYIGNILTSACVVANPIKNIEYTLDYGAILKLSRQELDRPRYVLFDSGEVFADGELLGERDHSDIKIASRLDMLRIIKNSHPRFAEL